MAEVRQQLDRILRQVNPFDESCKQMHEMKLNRLIDK
jgi:hypothetical protein